MKLRVYANAPVTRDRSTSPLIIGFMNSGSRRFRCDDARGKFADLSPLVLSSRSDVSSLLREQSEILFTRESYARSRCTGCIRKKLRRDVLTNCCKRDRRVRSLFNPIESDRSQPIKNRLHDPDDEILAKYHRRARTFHERERERGGFPCTIRILSSRLVGEARSARR